MPDAAPHFWSAPSSVSLLEPTTTTDLAATSVVTDETPSNFPSRRLIAFAQPSQVMPTANRVVAA